VQFDLIVVGSFVTAGAVLWLVAGPYIWGAILFIVTLSIGEALWSPRVFEYTSTVAPKGREGTYMALSSAPNFLSKLVVGGMSGILLEDYCPSENHCDGQKLWLIIFLVTLTSPIMLLLLKPFLNEKDFATTNEYDQGVASGRTSEDLGVGEDETKSLLGQDRDRIGNTPS
jgi:MFS family permease